MTIDLNYQYLVATDGEYWLFIEDEKYHYYLYSHYTHAYTGHIKDFVDSEGPLASLEYVQKEEYKDYRLVGFADHLIEPDEVDLEQTRIEHPELFI